MNIIFRYKGVVLNDIESYICLILVFIVVVAMTLVFERVIKEVDKKLVA